MFDFDGTIADTFFIAVDVFRKLSDGRHENSDEEIEELRSLPASDAIRRVGARWWHLPYILYYARKEVHRRQDEIKPIDGIPAVLKELHARGYKLYIVSSNSTKNVNRFLQNNNLDTYFSSTYGNIGIFAKSGGLRKIIKEHHWKSEDCCYIGDEARDVEAARRIPIACVSVAWGYNNMTGLKRGHPEKIVKKPSELLDVFQPLH